METFIIVTLSVYIGVGLYEFYLATLHGENGLERIIRSIVWPVEVFYVIKDIFWKYRN